MSDRTTCGCCNTGFHCDCDRILSERDSLESSNAALREEIKKCHFSLTTLATERDAFGKRETELMAENMRLREALEEAQILFEHLNKAPGGLSCCRVSASRPQAAGGRMKRKKCMKIVFNPQMGRRRCVRRKKHDGMCEASGKWQEGDGR